MNRKLYPADWKKISADTIKRAGDRCELCYAPNREEVFRRTDGSYPWQIEAYGVAFGKTKKTKIVLTVHHIDHDKMNSSKHNLIALCQKCHLRLDLVHHIKHRKEKSCAVQERVSI